MWTNVKIINASIDSALKSHGIHNKLGLFFKHFKLVRINEQVKHSLPCDVVASWHITEWSITYKILKIKSMSHTCIHVKPSDAEATFV